MLGITLGYTAAYSIFSGNYLWTTIASYRPFVYPIGFLLWGLIIGLFQATVLAHKTTRAWAWVPACGVAMLGMGYFTLAMPMFLPPIVGGAMFGVLTAGPIQWIVQARDRLRERNAGVVSEK
jgi:hypothetical protein